jgi:glycosyltransferase involved in cell wall biosynthesis
MNMIAPTQKNPDIAIIICTFNPEDRMFLRVLQSIQVLEIAELTVECLLVDNNSDPAIATLDYVQAFLKVCPWAKVIVEPQQGLSFARIAGIKASSASIVAFFDDDNEVAPDYLKVAIHHLKIYPGVAIWGPGKVGVEFLDPVSPWFEKHFRSAFHEKNFQQIEYGCVGATWTNFYPAGMGQVLRRDVLEKYCQAISEGQLSFTGRKGNRLSSAEDIQIVWEAIKLGFSVGVSPELKLKHLIPAKRTTLEYIKKLTFGTASSYIPALAESFPAEKSKVAQEIPSNGKILLGIFKRIVLNLPKLSYQLLLIDLIGYLGHYVGVLQATNSKKRQWLHRVVQRLNVE